MGDPLDDAQDATERVAAREAVESVNSPPKSQPTPLKERVRVYLRDHPDAAGNQVATTLGADPGTVRRIIRERQGSNNFKPKSKDAPRGEGNKGSKGKSDTPIADRAGTLLREREARTIVDEIAQETTEQRKDALASGRWVRDWYISRGLHSEFPHGSLEFVQTIADFWWKNRDMIGELRRRADDLELDLEAAHAALDPEAEYQRRTEQLVARDPDEDARRRGAGGVLGGRASVGGRTPRGSTPPGGMGQAPASRSGGKQRWGNQ